MIAAIAEGAGGGRYSRARLDEALAELCAVVGVDHRDATLIRFVNNGVYRLARDPIVVRIVLAPELRRRAAKVAIVAQWLAENGVPAVRLLPGVEQPVRAGPHVATFWEAVLVGGPRPTSTDLAELLLELHKLPLPPLPIDEWEPLADARRRLLDAEDLDPSDRIFLEDRCAELEADLAGLNFVLPPALIHGDAHLGNLIPTPAGPMLCDFDSTGIGPREWDLTPLAVGQLRFGHPAEQYQQLVERYGFDVTTWDGYRVLHQLREIKLVTSVVPILRSNAMVRAQFKLRLRAIRDGGPAALWSPHH